MNEKTLHDLRQQKDQFFKAHPQSPLLPEDRPQFRGLKYYPYNPDLDLEVEVKEFAEKTPIQMQTSTGEIRTYQRWGEFTFEVEEQPARLTIYYSPQNGYFFLPFMDATSGEETYDSGRYLDIEPLDGNEFIVDFNQAYSPYCAYSPYYSCPIPPAENRLNVPIKAGEKHYK